MQIDIGEYIENATKEVIEECEQTITSVAGDYFLNGMDTRSPGNRDIWSTFWHDNPVRQPEATIPTRLPR